MMRIMASHRSGEQSQLSHPPPAGTTPVHILASLSPGDVVILPATSQRQLDDHAVIVGISKDMAL